MDWMYSTCKNSIIFLAFSFTWCFLNVNDSSIDDCYSFIMSAVKSGRVKILEPYNPPPAKKSCKECIRGKLLGTTVSTEVMEEEIWKDFPEDLFESMIARLPIATFFRFLSVCQKWNSLLSSQSFSQHCAQVQQANPWFYTITLENVNSGAIYHPTILSSPKKMIILPAASAGGLVCFLDIGHQYLYVCNPLTQSLKELPARSIKFWSRIAVGMTIDGSCYKILWVGCDGEYEVYDSMKNSWTHLGNISSSINLPLLLNFRSQTVSIGIMLYFMRSEPEGIVTYDMVTDHAGGVGYEECCHMRLHLGAAEDDSLVEGGGQNAKHMVLGFLWKARENDLLG